MRLAGIFRRVKSEIRVWSVLATSTVCLAALSACGSATDDGAASGKPSSTPSTSYATTAPKTIVADATAAMAQISTMHVTGTVTDEGATYDVDLVVTGKRECSGTLSVGGATVKVRAIGGKSWFNGDKAFWTSQGADAAMTATAGKWVDSTDFNMFAAMCKPAYYLKAVDDGAMTGLRTTGTSTVDGTDTVTLSGANGAGTFTAEVATDEPHRLLEVTAKPGGTLAFGDFDKPFTATAPGADEVVQIPS